MDAIDATPYVSVGDTGTLFRPHYLFVKFGVGTNTDNDRDLMQLLRSTTEKGRAIEINAISIDAIAIVIATAERSRQSERRAIARGTNQVAASKRNFFGSGRERGADHPGQIDFAIWFGKQQHVSVETPVNDHGVLRIA